MQKSLPRQTARSLNPPANVLEPYTFFESVGDHPFQPLDTTLNLRNAWWLADAALLAYSTEADVKKAFGAAGIAGEIAYFHGVHSTQAYVISMTDAIVLAFRGTQVDNFWSSVLDFAVDAQFLPLPDAHGHLVHAGFNAALAEVWTPVAAHLKSEQAKRPRPLWITGHSLGAALATLAANRCCDDATAGLKGAYTFGSPRVGDPRFGAAHSGAGVPVPQRLGHRPASAARSGVPAPGSSAVHRRRRPSSSRSLLGDGGDAGSRRALHLAQRRAVHADPDPERHQG